MQSCCKRSSNVKRIWSPMAASLIDVEGCSSAANPRKSRRDLCYRQSLQSRAWSNGPSRQVPALGWPAYRPAAAASPQAGSSALEGGQFEVTRSIPQRSPDALRSVRTPVPGRARPEHRSVSPNHASIRRFTLKLKCLMAPSTNGIALSRQPCQMISPRPWLRQVPPRAPKTSKIRRHLCLRVRR